MKPRCPNGYKMSEIHFHDDESLGTPYAIRWVICPQEMKSPPIDIVWPYDAEVLDGMKMWEEGRWKDL